MKVLLILGSLLAYSLAATVPSFVPISTYQDSLKTSLENNPNSPRIVNGFPADANQFPHQVSVLAPVGGGYSICGGSLISSEWVLTACHCTVSHRQFNLRIGSLNLWSGGVAVTSFNSINHPQYNPSTLNHDVALIRLPNPIGLGPSINFVRLPKSSHQGNTFVGERSTVSGFGVFGHNSGVSQILRYVDMKVIPNAQCAGVYGSAVIVDHVVCGLGHDKPENQGHCSGDSGGPLVYNDSDGLIQIGVVSFGAAAGCELGYPCGYMRTSHFVEWVGEHTNIPVRP